MAKRYTTTKLLAGAIFGLALATGSVVAQTTDQDHDHVGHNSFTCGSDWAQQVDYDAVAERTRQENPELYREMAAQAKLRENGQARLASASAVDGLIDEFWLVNRSTGQQERHTAVSKHVSERMIIWVDVLDTVPGRIRQATIDKLVEGLEVKVKEGPNTRDPNTGVIQNDIAIFGSPPKDQWAQEDDFIHLLLLDIDNGDLTGGTLSGYFSPNDQTTNIGSNNRNLLYIDSPPLWGSAKDASIENVLGTVAHEFQHLINHRHYTGSASDRETHWLYNEGLSEVASLRNGYMDRTAFSTMTSPNRFGYFDAPIGATSGDTILPGYERGMLWTHYLSEQYGDGFLKNLVIAGGRNLEPVQTALNASGIEYDANRTFSEFWVANYIQSASNFQGDDAYRYQLSIGGRNATTISKIFPTGMANEELQLKAFGALLPRYTNTDISGSGLKIKFLPNGRDYGIHAIMFRDGGGIDVRPLTIDQEENFEDVTAVVLVIASLEGDGQTVQWTAETTTLGVEEYATNAGALSVTNIAPNPVQNDARITFRTGAASQVTLDIYDMQGKALKRVLDNAPYEGGLHTLPVDLSDLGAGVYTLRLVDSDGAMSVRQIVVVK